jgi:hypothetical protein
MAKPEVTSLGRSASASDVAEVLQRDGAVILRELVDSGAIDAMMRELNPYLEARPNSEGSFVGAHTKRVHGLLGKSAVVGDLLLNPSVLGAMDAVLGPWCECYQMSSLSLTSIGPGQAPQELHRDDALYPFAHPSERQAECTSFWALSDFTFENGATQVVPGSHLWDDERLPREDEVAYAEMPKGSVCIFLGSTYHGGGRNITECEWRTGMYSGYCLGWLRQEQNFYLTTPPEVARALPEELARLIGYTVHRPFLGWAQDMRDPWEVISEGYVDGSAPSADLLAAGTDRLKQGPGVKVA